MPVKKTAIPRSAFMKEPKASQKEARGKTAKTNTSKLSLYPLSVEDALRAAARTGRVTPVKPKQANRKRKKSAPLPLR
jgi:hypothetical protein